MVNGRKMSAHYSPLTTRASLSWMGDPEDDDEEEEEEEKKKQQEEEDNEGEEEEVPWQVEKRKRPR